MSDKDIARHLKYFQRCQSMLPHQYTSQDLNQMALVNFTLSSLDLLAALPFTSQTDKHIDWIYTHLVSSGRGFRGSLNAQLPHTDLCNDYDPPHLPSTYFAIISLVVLGDDLSRLDAAVILAELTQLQGPDGAFVSFRRDTDVDVRFTYLAAAIRHILTKRADFDRTRGINFDVDRAVSYVQSCRRPDGGYGHRPGAESHSGLTFCALAALYLLGQQLSPLERDETLDWLVHHQSAKDGGFNGREGKESDVCYCFWNYSSLVLLDGSKYVDQEALINYLTQCQSNRGGFGKTVGDMPDLYHSYLGIAVQNMMRSPETVSLESCALSMTKRALQSPFGG